MKPQIHFSHEYYKMPILGTLKKGKHTIIGIQVHEDIYELPVGFLHYDTAFWNGKETEEYPLPMGKGIIIFIFSCWENDNPKLWTTIRRWTQSKYNHYKGLVGKEVEIVIEEVST